ncbi:MAG: leucyl aminopeptidase [Aquincola sp.]|nr:leucyl aminopeptidase [Aquincola sp.]MDH5329049.1 leucyl aminopeptidase [Aquincola sp.]
MDFTTQPMPAGGLGAVIADALLVVVVGTSVPPSLDKTLGALLGDAVAQGDFEFKPNRVLYIHRPAGCQVARLTLVCAPNPTPTAFKAAVACGLAAIKAFGVTALAVARVGGDAMTDAHAEALAAAVGDAVYLYRHTKPSAPAAPRLTRVVLVSGRRESASLARGLQRGAAIAAGVEVARECANRPGNHATPTFLASEARRIAKQYGMKVEVFDRRQIEKIGMGSFLAVAQGSDEPPRFIVVRYEGAAKSKAPIVLVGKGITFDSGGISIKPAAEMDEMKFDMGGAASVLGTLRAIGEIKPKVNVIGLIAACENLPSGRAIKPGDVVRSLSGQTIEILNTDAEGRLILCDALTYAERFKPAAVIDIATLTGACVVALGHHHSGLFAADEALAAELLAASRHAQDPAWRMPLDDEYGEVLKSHFADVANVGPRAGGAITAAMFLKRFAAKYPWAHLDVAGTAWKSGAAKGATGRPVGLLTHFVLARG